jgi:hypothetical protein
MNYKIENCNLILDTFENFNFEIPETLTFFPENFFSAKNESDFIYPDSLSELNKIFRIKQIPIIKLTPEIPKYRSRKSADLIVPTLFISFSLFSDNSMLISLALNVLANYITDFFKGTLKNRKVKFEIIIETKKRKEFSKISYDGDIEGLKDLEGIIKSLKK